MIRTRQFFLILILLASGQLQAADNLRINGLGFWKDRQLNRQILFLHGAEDRESVQLDAAFIEDTAFLLMEQLAGMGYLRPTLHADFTLQGQEEKEPVPTTWEWPYRIQVDADFSASDAHFRVDAGMLYYYEAVEVNGVSAIPDNQLQRFFVPSGALFTQRSDRAYTPRNFSNRSNRLLQSLQQLGYRDARLVTSDAQLDHATGAVRALVEIREGPLHKVRSVTLAAPSEQTVDLNLRDFEGQVFNDAWQQELRNSVLTSLWTRGHADATAVVRTTQVETAESGLEQLIQQDAVIRINPGPVVQLAGVRFEGADYVAHSVLRRQAKLGSSDLLSIVETAEAKRRLMGLGIFDSVDLVFDPPDGTERAAVYNFTPSQTRRLELLAGWGSYELARAGFRWTHRNPFRRAHVYSLQSMASVRAHSARLNYSIPQIFGTLSTAEASTEYNFREEVSFDRSDASFSIGASTTVTRLGIILQYGYQIESREVERSISSEFAALDDVTVASVSLRAYLDRRDNPLSPSSGFMVSASLKTAARELGGNAEFQRVDLRVSYHRPLSSSLILHTSARLGTLYTRDDDPAGLPFSERFFPGGENTVRGYREGQASPLDANGDAIGASSQLIFNVEIEQRVFGNWSLVAFYDTVGLSRDEAFSVGDYWLGSVGLGVRWRSVVGPVRLEYGHNLDRRPEDPSGTFHFSIGFPF